MNNMKTNFTKESNVYHIKNMGTKINKITLPKIISDHPMLIYQMNIPIPFKEEFEEITLFDKNIIKLNNNEIEKITQNNLYIPNFKNSSETIRRKRHEIKLSTENYIQHFEELKAKEKERFKEINKRKAEEITKLIETRQLGSEPYQRQTSLMQLGKTNIWFKPESTSQKNKIIQGFKELYNHIHITPCSKQIIANLLLQQLETIANIPESSSLEPPKKPRSSARDLQGFSQREIWNYIKAENLKLSAYKLAFIIKNAANCETGDQLIHRTSKIILKKKKDFVETWKDVRAITIMPAIYMLTDKITNQYLKQKLQPLIYDHQHGARCGMSTATAKMNLLYTLNKENYKYSILLDIEKAFDKLNKDKLQQAVNRLVTNHIDNKLLNLILEGYKLINMSLLEDKIQPTTGIPQGSVYGPIFFLIYINELFNIIKEKHPNEITQAFVDDIIISAKRKQELESAFNTAQNFLNSLEMNLNINKCEFLSDREDEEITDNKTNIKLASTLMVKYLGQ